MYVKRYTVYLVLHVVLAFLTLPGQYSLDVSAPSVATLPPRLPFLGGKGEGLLFNCYLIVLYTEGFSDLKQIACTVY